METLLIEQIGDEILAEREGEKPTNWPIESLVVGRFLTTEPKPVDWLVDGLLARGIIGLTYGAGGSFKTWLLIQMCLQMAVADALNDCLFLGAWNISKPRRVLYCYPEDVENDFHYRFKLLVDRLCELHPADAVMIREKAIERFLFLSREHFFEGDTSGLFDIVGEPTSKWFQLCKTVEDSKIDLLVIDTKSVCSATEENDNNANAALIKHCGLLRDRTGTSIVLVHHVNKASRTTGDGETAFRGASSLLDNCRFALYLKTKELGGISHLEVQPVKVTHGPKPEKIVCSLSGFPWFCKTTAQDSDPEAKEDRDCDALINYLKEHPRVSGKRLTESKTLKKTIGGIGRIRDIINICLDNSLLSRQGKGCACVYYIA